MTPDRLIPVALKALTNLVSDDDTRPAISGIHVTQNTKGKDVYEVTDGHQLCRATVVSTEKPADYPDAVLPETPGTRVDDAIIPVSAWDAAMKSAPKRGYLPVLNTVACAMRAEKGTKPAITLATTDLETPRVTTTAPVDATPYQVRQIYPTQEPTATITMDAHLLAQVFKTWAAICGGRLAAVRIDVYGPESPIRLSALSDDGAIHLSGLVMPCNPKTTVPEYADPDEMAPPVGKKKTTVSAGKEPLP